MLHYLGISRTTYTNTIAPAFVVLLSPTRILCTIPCRMLSILHSLCFGTRGIVNEIFYFYIYFCSYSFSHANEWAWVSMKRKIEREIAHWLNNNHRYRNHNKNRNVLYYICIMTLCGNEYQIVFFFLLFSSSAKVKKCERVEFQN